MRRKEETTGLEQELLDRLTELQASVAKLVGEERGTKEVLSLKEKVGTLQRDISKLEIQKSQLTEANERERRETEHMVGLERKRQEFELEAGKRDAVLTVREENLEADRSRFEEQMRFIMERFEQEVASQKELMAEMLKRLPTVTWDVQSNGKEKAHADKR